MRKLLPYLVVFICTCLTIVSMACAGDNASAPASMFEPCGARLDFSGMGNITLSVVPAKLCVGNATRNLRGEFYIVNNNAKYVTYAISYRQPSASRAKEGYSIVLEARDWLLVDPSQVTVKRRNTANVKFRVDIPKGVKLPDKWEFWINVIPTQGSGDGSFTFWAGIDIRCLVDMASESY